jgi:hypothetical protein
LIIRERVIKFEQTLIGSVISERCRWNEGKKLPGG